MKISLKCVVSFTGNARNKAFPKYGVVADFRCLMDAIVTSEDRLEGPAGSLAYSMPDTGKKPSISPRFIYVPMLVTHAFLPSRFYELIPPQRIYSKLGGNLPFAADHGLPPSTTTTTPKCPRVMPGFVCRDGSWSRTAPPSVPSHQPSHYQRSSLTSSYIHQQQAQPGCPTFPVGSVDVHRLKCSWADDGQSPSELRVSQHRQQIAGYPTQQYQSQAQSQSYGSRVRPTNAPMSQPPQPLYGYSPTSAGPIYSQHAHPAHAPTRSPSMYATPILTVPSQGTSGGSTQGQEQYSYHSVPVAYPQLMQMQPYQQPPYTSPTPATIAGTFSQANNPSSHVPPYISQANLTASSETPISGAVPGGSNASVGSTSPMGQPKSPNQRVGRIRSNRNDSRQVSTPYRRPTPATGRTRPITYEGNLVRLQQRCKGQGADEGAIELLGKVFTNEVSLEALTRRLTDAEIETKEFGIVRGKIYIAFLESINEEGTRTHYACRLCHSGQIWKHPKDVVRHLRRDHFGLADVCNKWYVSGCSLTLLRINILLVV